jgi:hypothetical protein
VAHIYNPSYSGGRDQKDHGSKLAWANSSRDPTSKNPLTKNWAGRVAQGVGSEFKPQYHKKKKKERKKENVHAKKLPPSPSNILNILLIVNQERSSSLNFFGTGLLVY